MSDHWDVPGDAYDHAIRQLRAVLDSARSGKDRVLTDILAARDDVLTRYRSLFSPEHLSILSPDEFRGFLSFDNNRHWSSIHRHVTSLTSDMDALRHALSVLLDETRPIRSRLDAVLSSRGSAKVHGMGKAVATPILLIAHPDRYGVWNEPSEEGMQTLGIWPNNYRGLSEGVKYERMNALLRRLRDDLGVDFWTLDALWWRLGTLGGTSQSTAYTQEQYEEVSLTLDELDARREELVRVEQGFVRNKLFGVDREAECGICGVRYPIGLLRAAHIKRRAACSAEEKRDFRNNVVPMCTFGCDELFERGYIVVRHGHIEVIPRPRTPAVDDYLTKIRNRPCLLFYSDRRPYFEWHADWHSREDQSSRAGN
jgi:hypothetical protein